MKRLMSVTCLLALATTAWADERRNPFAHSLSVAAPDSPAADDTLDDEDVQVNAILVAGGKSLVSVNGSVIGVGEETLGYRLLAVGEDSATFERRGSVVTLSLFAEPAEDRRRD